jgi:Flp pilus assembly protein TadB
MCLAWLLVRCIQNNNIFAAAAEKIREGTDATSKNRRMENEVSYARMGNGQKISPLTKIDIALEMSGMKKVFGWLNTELLILITAVIAVASAAAAYIAGHSIIYSFAAVCVVLSAGYMSVYLLSARNSKRIDDGILQFANLLFAYSNSSSDIITIFEQVAPQLEEPLRSPLLSCVNEVRLNGDLTGAFARLTLKLRHRKMTELLQSVEECSKNNANYSAVISRIYESISIYKGEKDNRAQMVRGARLNILILLAIFIVCILVLAGITEMSVYDMFFSSGTGGRIMFFTGTVELIYIIYKFISIGSV